MPLTFDPSEGLRKPKPGPNTAAYAAVRLFPKIAMATLVQGCIVQDESVAKRLISYVRTQSARTIRWHAPCLTLTPADSAFAAATEIHMIKNILVCLEGSPSSDAAMRTAVQIARETKAFLVGMAIVDKPDIEAGTATGVGGASFKHERDEALLAQGRAHASAWLDAFDQYCRDKDIRARTLEVFGKPVESILDEMKHHDLTVIGREANFKFETQDKDSRTLGKILRRSYRPVLLVPGSTPSASGLLGKTVLVAYDGSVAANRALAGFLGSGLAQSRDIHIATFGDDGEQAEDIAVAAADRLAASGIHAFAHGFVSALPTEEAIVDFGRQIGAGLLVMGACARSGFSAIFHRSKMNHVIAHSSMPLCVQH